MLKKSLKFFLNKWAIFLFFSQFNFFTPGLCLYKKPSLKKLGTLNAVY